MIQPGLLDPRAALVAMIDIQRNHYPLVTEADATLDRLLRFLAASRKLDVPVLWTEHYPRAFGPTLEPVADVLRGLEPIAKTSFGCFGEPRFARAVERADRSVLYLVGSETHICIQQTGLVALERGMGVVLVTDCLTARHRHDHGVALRRLEGAGALPATWESVVYEWMRGAGHARFKEVLPLVKG